MQMKTLNIRVQFHPSLPVASMLACNVSTQFSVYEWHSFCIVKFMENPASVDQYGSLIIDDLWYMYDVWSRCVVGRKLHKSVTSRLAWSLPGSINYVEVFREVVVQGCGISSALAREIPQSCTKPSTNMISTVRYDLVQISHGSS